MAIQRWGRQPSPVRARPGLEFSPHLGDAPKPARAIHPRVAAVLLRCAPCALRSGQLLSRRRSQCVTARCAGVAGMSVGQPGTHAAPPRFVPPVRWPQPCTPRGRLCPPPTAPSSGASLSLQKPPTAFGVGSRATGARLAQAVGAPAYGPTRKPPQHGPQPPFARRASHPWHAAVRSSSGPAVGMQKQRQPQPQPQKLRAGRAPRAQPRDAPPRHCGGTPRL